MARNMSVLRRALLYVPSSSTRMLEKSRSLRVDCVAYDLEDSVTSGKKAEARAALREFLSQPRPASIREQSVRINAVPSGHALSDLTEILASPNVDSVVVPKVDSASDLHFVTNVIHHFRDTSDSQASPLQIIASIESAKAIMDLSAICKASPYLTGLIFAAEDFANDLSLTRTPSLTEFLYARAAIVTASRAHNLPSTIDLVCTNYKGEMGPKILREECLDGVRHGFNGKQCIHPSQVEVTQEVFSPSEEEVIWSVRILIAADKASTRQGRGAYTLDGKMIDAPVIAKARGVVRKAELCNFDVDTVKAKWSHQEPE
ncbi:Pyruvate/Phosphoenolpyruvate kinase-like domain-containing protein [Apiosordaria backusii]|uniref:Pyruvate/Phosphoenolpyruvate kinase-like domain-containing protein n=1 Tax=Apiosordaria backusii TaxID=314023 RepID=A0AA40BSM3_9PEZI|nr:Pyruvate/Phosphoenolpyruvate kinase-like domain-containing protein [Apiosordaria backusii]